mmetsp:Transcript_8138/g.22502  ORF Transcript_8138/g.22502 Transcript_8138/m.22502 type:complete len:195 (-) Transcript_8138:43-627(-)
MGSACSRRKAKEDPPMTKNPYEALTPAQQVHAAACNGDVKHIEKLAAEGVDFNTPRQPDNFHALDACAWCEATECGLALLRLGADPCLTMQAVVGAAANGSQELLVALLDAGGPVDQELSDSSALRWAIEMNQEECAEILLKRGAWEKEPEQDWLLARFKRKRMAKALAAVATLDPSLAEDCVMPPYWSGCSML